MVFEKGKKRVIDYISEEIESRGALLFAVIDPLDYPSLDDAISMGRTAAEAGAAAVLIGGSLGVQGELLDYVTKSIAEAISVPTILFPGNVGTTTKYADAIYFMSMLNSRSPYWITGAQTNAAFLVKRLGIEPLPTAYIVVHPGGTVGWVGDVNLIPRNKPMVAASMALAAQYMGFGLVITDTGSAPAEGHVPLEMIKAVSSSINVPYIVAGGIRTSEQAASVVKAGADVIQVGTAFEKESTKEKVKSMVKAIEEAAKSRQ